MAEAKIQKRSLQPAKSVDYVETLMYGQYQKDLGDYARKEAARLKAIQDKRRRKHPFKKYQPGKCDPCLKRFLWLRRVLFSRIGEDWVFLTLLGVVMALLSFIMDYAIEKCQEAYKWLYLELAFSPPLQFFAWVVFPLVFICFSTGFVHIVGPNAIGSGIPEMKTILRGVVLKEYLTFRTLISKMVGLSTSLGSGLLIGKEGPFVHVASIAATLLGKLITSFRGIYENESRNSEMLAAACAVGVACTFAAPIGGVLFSIEVTATYFAVRNYWRGFYSAVCGAFVFRLLAIFFKNEETLTALFKTDLRQHLPFDPIELLAFASIGLVCGFAGALFVFTHRKIVEFIRGQRRMTDFLQKNRFIFPSVVVLILSSLTCPLGLGQFMAGNLSNSEAVNMLFSNMTWSTGYSKDIEEERILANWKGPHNNLYVTLGLFILMRFWMSAIAITLPVPAGVFMPVFTIGAAFGRLVGESMATWFPHGIGNKPVTPGGYAIVGAAALSGSVTHTISTSVIVFELTGQMGHVLPAVIAVLISNAVAHCLQLSIYDSLIQIKKLPYLPDIINPQAINAHSVTVEDFMLRRFKKLTLKSTYWEAYELLQNHSFRAFPIVDSRDTMILLGSVQRLELEQMLEKVLTPGSDMTFQPSPPLEMELQPVTNLMEETPKTVSPTVSIADSNEVTPNVRPPVDRQQSKRSFRFSVSRVESPTSPVSTAQNSPRSVRASVSGEPQVIPERTPPPLKGILKNPEEGQFQGDFDYDVEMLSHWERIQLARTIDWATCIVDPAPFQLIGRTSLYKVHSIFSLLSLNHAYVTCSGHLVGVVGLKEVREAIQGQISGTTSGGDKKDNNKKENNKSEGTTPTATFSGGNLQHEDATVTLGVDNRSSEA